MDWQFVKPITDTNSNNQLQQCDERPNRMYQPPKPSYEHHYQPPNPSYEPRNLSYEHHYQPLNPSYSIPRAYVTPNPYLTRRHRPPTPTRHLNERYNPYEAPIHHAEPRPYGEPYPTVYSEDRNIHPPRPQQIHHPSYHSRHSPTPPPLVFVYSFRMFFKHHKQIHLIPI